MSRREVIDCDRCGCDGMDEREAFTIKMRERQCDLCPDCIKDKLREALAMLTEHPESYERWWNELDFARERAGRPRLGDVADVTEGAQRA